MDTAKYQTTQFDEGVKSLLAGLGLAATAALTPNISNAASHEAKPAITHTDKVTADNVVAATLVGEAGGEGEQGMQAVLNVIMNRSKGDFSKASKVCLAPKQFSMWNNTDHVKVISKESNHPKWNQAVHLIQLAKEGKLPDITGGATHYYAQKIVHPSWAKKMKQTVVIGNHTFLK